MRKPCEKLCASAFHPSKTLWLFEFGRGGTRSRIVFLEVFAHRPLILSDDNNLDKHTVLCVFVCVYEFLFDSATQQSAQISHMHLVWSNTVFGVFGFVFTSLCLTVLDPANC